MDEYGLEGDWLRWLKWIGQSCVQTGRLANTTTEHTNQHNTAPDEALQHGPDPYEEEPGAGGTAVGVGLLPVRGCAWLDMAKRRRG